MKRLVAMLLVLAFALSFAACGNSAQDPQATPAADNGQAPAATETDAGNAPADPCLLYTSRCV